MLLILTFIFIVLVIFLSHHEDDIKIYFSKKMLADLLYTHQHKINYRNNSWDIYGDVVITKELVKNGKLIVKFGVVQGNFICSDVGLTTLEGCPTNCVSNFVCSNNNLTTLEYSPNVVLGHFDCSNNQITSLKHCNYVVDNLLKVNLLKVTNNCIKEECNKIDMDKISLYKNPYHYFRKFNYECK